MGDSVSQIRTRNSLVSSNSPLVDTKEYNLDRNSRKRSMIRTIKDEGGGRRSMEVLLAGRARAWSEGLAISGQDDINPEPTRHVWPPRTVINAVELVLINLVN